MIPIISSALIALTPQIPPVSEDSSLQVDSIPIAVETMPEVGAQTLGQPLQIGNEKTGSSKKAKKELNISQITHLITASRQGEQRKFEFNHNSSSFQLAQPETNQSENNSPSGVSEKFINVVEVIADQQEYLEKEQIIKAKGNVVIRFSRGVLIADQVMVNLADRIAVAEGNVILERGEQTLRGDRFEYYFVQDEGVIFNASGEIYQPKLAEDFSPDSNNPVSPQPLSWQIEANQPLQRVVSAEGIGFSVGNNRDLSLLEKIGATPVNKEGGQINRFRFEAERVDFDSDGWHATNISLTNDPFSPPEFEIRADTADLTSISPFVDELTTTNSRLVFDRRVSVPIFQDRLVFDKRDRRPGLFNIGFDGEDLGGLYIEREFEIYNSEQVRLTITPQFLLQRAFSPDSFLDENAENPDDNGGMFNQSSYGFVTKLDVDFTSTTDLVAIANFTGLDLDNVENRLRATLRINQKVGPISLSEPHTLSFQYNYRERLFNGSLGFQTVQESVGGVITSPYIRLGNSGLGVIYQGSMQNITADTDRLELLEPVREDNLANLTRYQGAALITGGILLWSDSALPPTAEEGLKYTSTPVSPYIRLTTGLTGVASYYSNGETQPSFTASLGLQGQFGHFSNLFFDYTGFNVSFRQGFRGDQSPFFFDRFVDDQVLSLGLTQQLVGPVRAGVQTFLNVKTNQEISTDYFLEYSRRTYNIMLRYNPVLQIGSINLRISDFNWEGNAGPFEGTGIKPVVDGVTR